MAYMTDEKIAKKNFIENELQAMLHAATMGCAGRLSYGLDHDTAEEYVIVRWRPDAKTAESFLVNVTGDSRWAIAKDVMKAVAKRFE